MTSDQKKQVLLPASGLFRKLAVLAPLMLIISVFLTGMTLAASKNFSKRAAESRRQQAQNSANSVGWKTFVASAHSIRPSLSLRSGQNMSAAIARYQNIAANGGWDKISNGPTMKAGLFGAKGKRVKALRRRLVLTGDLPQSRHGGKRFDKALKQAVRRFQYRHGLLTHGVVDKATLNALNVPAQARLRTLKVNLDRVIEAAQGLKNRYIVVNVPSATLETVEDGYVYSRHITVVGKTARRTPVLKSEVQELNFFPYWHPPLSIIKKDILPMARKDSRFFQRINMRVIDPRTGQEIDPAQVDWNQATPTRYFMRQDPGKLSAMATLKVNFPNAHSVYIHDTPKKKLFSKRFRYHSSGCIRLDQPRLLTEWLLRGQPGWSKHKIRQVLESEQRLDVPVTSRIQVRFVYLTSWATTDDIVYFRNDVYKLDAAG